MNITLAVGVIDWWAVLAATVAAYVLGGIWYAPPVFGNRWMTALGKTRDQLGSPVKPMALQFVATLIMAVALAWVMAGLGARSWYEGMLVGFLLSLGLIATSMFSDWIFCGFNWTLFRIQCAYKIVNTMLMGAVIGHLVG